MDRPQVLFLVHRVPFPPNRGDRIRSFHLLKFLAERADVHLAFLHAAPLEDGVLDALRPLCKRFAAIEHAGLGRWARGVVSLATGGTATEGLFHSPKLKTTLRDWAQDTPFTTVVAFCSSMAPYAELPELRDLPLVVDLVDVDSQKWFDYAAQGPSLKRPLYRIEGQRLRRAEKRIGDRAKAVLLVSEQEARLYRSFAPDAPCYAIANGVDLAYFRPDALAQRVPGRCVFTGALDYQANIDGVTWFCEHVWEPLRRRVPEATFHIVGRDPGPAVERLGRFAGVTVVGTVPDVRPHVASASVVVAPLRVARGIQNKVLEAMAMGQPVVASPQALEGIELPADDLALAPRTADDWVTTLGDLLNDEPRQRSLGAEGRSFVETHYDWPSRLAPLGDLLDSISLSGPKPVAALSTSPHDS